MIDKKNLRHLAEKASCGPWKQNGYDKYEFQYMFPNVSNDEWEIAECHFLSTDIPEQNIHNAAFIASANPTTIISLLNEIETLGARVKMLVTSINEVQCNISGIANNSSTIFDGVKKSWNINARALSNCPNEQNEYLSTKKEV